jgi:hypothetical protein
MIVISLIKMPSSRVVSLVSRSCQAVQQTFPPGVLRLHPCSSRYELTAAAAAAVASGRSIGGIVCGRVAVLVLVLQAAAAAAAMISVAAVGCRGSSVRPGRGRVCAQASPLQLTLRAHSRSRSHGIRWQHWQHCLRAGSRARPGSADSGGSSSCGGFGYIGGVSGQPCSAWLGQEVCSGFVLAACATRSSHSHGVRRQHRRHCLRAGIRAQPGRCRRCAWASPLRDGLRA